MTYTKEDKQLLSNIRQKLNDAFNYCLKNKYDGRPLVEAWDRFVKASQSIGGRPESKPHHKAEYWEDPETYSNWTSCKNPIIFVTEDFEIVRQKDLSKNGQRSQPKSIISPKNEDEMQPRRTEIERTPKKPIRPYYYKVNISWVERNDSSEETIKKLLNHLKSVGLEPVKIHDFNNGHEIEKTAEFKMKGGEEAFQWVKRCIIGAIELIVGGIPKFNIAVSGKEYEDFELN